jgi:hypothetical protein
LPELILIGQLRSFATGGFMATDMVKSSSALGLKQLISAANGSATRMVETLEFLVSKVQKEKPKLG